MIEQLLAQALALMGDFTPKIGAIIFGVSFIGEGFLISFPMVFELAFLAAGYHFSEGTLPLGDVLLFALMSQLGRQAGSLVLFALSRSSTSFLGKFIAKRLPVKPSEDVKPVKLLQRIDCITPLGVAFGRLLWLRIPLTLLLGARRKLKTLVLGIIISSFIYDFFYLGMGAIVGRTVDMEETQYILLYFVCGLLAVYGLTFAIRYLIKYFKRRGKKAVERSEAAKQTQEEL